MRKALGLVLGIHLMATGLVKAQTTETENKDGLNGRQVVTGTGAALGLGGAVLARVNLENMLSVYQRNAVKAFETNLDEGVRLNSTEIDRVARSIKTGDEVRITFRTSEGEERKVRISQLTKRKDEISQELARLRFRLLTITSKNPSMQVNGLSIQIRDNMIVHADLEKQLKDLHSGVTRIETRTATRVVDMNGHSVRELELFMMEKSRVGKHVLMVERVPRAARLEMAQMKRMMRGNIIAAAIGGAVVLEELVAGVLGDGLDSMMDSTVYVPVLQDAASAEQKAQ